MSTGVCGVIYVRYQDVKKEVELSFEFEKIANSLKIGMKMGGNISTYVYEEYNNKKQGRGILFELTDSPLDNYAEDLFAPETYERIESITVRMNKVQSLLKAILEQEYITKVIMYVNYLFFDGNENIVTVKSNEFCERIIRMYHESDDPQPTLRLEIIK